MKILCTDKNAKFLEEKPLVLFSKCSNFVDKKKGDCGGSKKRWAMK
jgi:hypothetical protein